MAKTKCIVCNSFMGYDIGLGHHPNGNSDHTKTKDGKWACTDRCARDYNRSMLNGTIQSEGIDKASAASIANAEAEKARISLEERKLREEKEAREAAERKEKGARFREEGKPLTAFLVELNPVYLGIAGLAYICTFIFIGNLHGISKILSYGLASMAGVLFLGFVIKDFAKLKGMAAVLIIVSLLLIPIGVTGFKVYKKSGNNSGDIEKMLAEQNALLQTTESLPDNSVVAKTKAELKSDDKNETEAQPVNNNERQILAGTLSNSLKGEWKGDFGGKELMIHLNDVDLDLTLTGYDEVKGNRRDLKGEIEDNGNSSFRLSLREPGDDKWDGAFKIKYVDGENSMTGTWTANNGKSSKNFTLTKN